MTNTQDFKDAYNIGREQQIITRDINGIEHALIPPGCTLESMERYMPAPVRIKCHPAFGDIDGFDNYVQEFKEPGTRIFVDENNLRFTAVFDFHSKKDGPAWGDHSASMALELSNEWSRFLLYDGREMKPTEFAELLEDNVQYVSADNNLTGADLLTMAQTFKIKVSGEVEVEETLKEGMKKLVIIDNSTVTARNTQGQTVEYPEKITFALRIFKNQDTYPIEVFLRTRKTEKILTFFIKIPDPKDIEEQALNLVIKKVKDVTGLPTLRGKFAGPSHK